MTEGTKTTDPERDYWEQHAAKYDGSMRLLGRPMPRMLELVAEATVDRDKILEVAAGTGLVTSVLSKSAKEVIATDYADAMVRRLRERMNSGGFKNVECRQADIYQLPFESATFDAVVAANVLHLVPDLESALASLTQVLKPGGILVMPTFCHNETGLSWVVSRVLAITGFPGHRRFSVASLRTAAEEASLQVVRCEAIPGLLPIGYVDAQMKDS